MSYKLYFDKPNRFNCNIEVDGTSISKSKARIVVESGEISYLFNGTIDEKGNCEITIPKTKNFLSENKTGKMRLEVIADDVFFEPWSSEFEVKASKNVQVVIKEQVEEEKTKLRVNVVQQKEEPHTRSMSEVRKPSPEPQEVFYTKEQLSKLLSKRK